MILALIVLLKAMLNILILFNFWFYKFYFTYNSHPNWFNVWKYIDLIEVKIKNDRSIFILAAIWPILNFKGVPMKFNVKE